MRGRWIITAADQPVLSDGALLLADGRIESVDSWSALRAANPDLEVRGNENSAILPGLINAHHHCHAISAIQHGVSDDLLEPWILAWAAMRPLDRHLNTLVSLGIQLGAGVTSLVDMMGSGGSSESFSDNLDNAIEACRLSGLRVCLAPGVTLQSHLVSGPGEDARFMDSLPESARQAATSLLPLTDQLDADDYFAVMEDKQRALQNQGRVAMWYGPPGPQWVDEAVLQRCHEEAVRWDCGIQTHVNESLYEKLLGPRSYGQSMMMHLHGLGVLSPRLSIAHGTWLNEEEIDLMAETGAAVSHNPGSNLRLRAGIAPFTALVHRGVTTGIGMDATTLNEDEDMFSEIRLAYRLQCDPRIERQVPGIADAFAAATVGGAKLMRMETQLGQLSPGYLADLVILDTERLCWPWVAPEADPMELILLRARRSDIREVLVGGESVWRDGAPTRFDFAAAATELAHLVAAWPHPELAASAAAELTPHLRQWYADWEVPSLSPWLERNSRR